MFKLLEVRPRAHVKTVKFVERPQGLELGKQLKSLRKKFPDFVLAPKNLNLTLKHEVSSNHSARKASLNPKKEKRPVALQRTISLDNLITA